MRKLTYLAVFEPSDDGYGVYFPDLPGCITWGDSFLSAEAAAKEALGLHLYGMEKDGEALPTPAASPVLDPETAPGALVSPVTVFPDVVRNEMDNRRVKTNIVAEGTRRTERRQLLSPVGNCPDGLSGTKPAAPPGSLTAQR